MIEPLFGSMSPNWPGIASPAFGWFQPTPSVAGRSTGTMPAIATSPQLNQSPTPQSFGFGMTPDSYAYGLPLNSLAFAGSPIVTAPALLAATALRRGQPTGPANDQEIEDFLYDAFELLTGTNEVEVRCEGGRVTLTGSVPHKRLKRDVGEIVWAIPTVNDVQNNVTVATRRRGRSSGREAEQHPGAANRKQA